MRVIITGDRKFSDYNRLNKKCMDIFTQLKQEGYNTERSNLEILTSRAKGPERLSELFASNNKINVKIFNTVSAGGIYSAYEKSKLMVDYASQDPEVGVVIAFWNNTGIVVNDLINKAIGKELRVFDIRF